LEIMI